MKSILLWFMLFLPLSAVAQEASLQFDQANQLYRNGDYRGAAALYEQIQKNGYEHPALFFNLGNAHFKLNEIPSALVWYERAKRLAPNDEDIAYNIRIANLRVVDKIEPLPQIFFARWWNSFSVLLSADGWAMFGAIFLWCAAFAGMIFLYFRSMLIQRLALLIAVLCVVTSAVGFVTMSEQQHRERAESTAIVVAPSVSVKSAPDAQSVDLFVLHEGVKVDLLDAVGDWRKVRLADGKIGWLAAGAVQTI
jgi:tetratricopeptide (TPR) repeat protein